MTKLHPIAIYILAMIGHDGIAAGSALPQAVELENVIAAVEAVADEEARR
ncbi:hypothetical protein [Methylobacterium sp. PvR107]|nr:hypothetical protein [Methylobacterium sp. PvR107]MBP1180919.1 hypothetical protein [Methylobacterium sp. PvR107]